MRRLLQLWQIECRHQRDRKRAAAHRAADPEKYRALGREDHKRHREERNVKSRKYYADNSDKRREVAREYRATHREERREYDRKQATDRAFREKRNARQKKWRAEIAEQRREHWRKWRLRNREQYNEKARRRRAENLDKSRLVGRLANQRSRSRARRAPGSYTLADIARILKAQHGKCYWCSRRLGKKWDIDHIVPLALVGTDPRATNYPENICIAHPSCNRSKNAKHPNQYARELGLLL